MTGETIQVLVSGLIIGSAYAMMAIGMSLVYGVSKVFNFAYGSFYSMAGYLAWLIIVRGLGYPVAFAVVIPALFFIGIASERLFLRPLRVSKNWEMLVVMSTLGLALFLDNLHLAIFGPFQKQIPPLFKAVFNIGGITVTGQDIAISVIAIGIIIGLWIFLNRTKQGLAMQAVAQDMQGALIVGIDKDRMFSLVFAIACVLVGVGGMLLAPKYFVSHLGGWEIMIKAWIVTAFGGMGSLTGAIYAAFILGVVEAFVGWQFGFTWTMFVMVAILIGMFVLRPQGLRGSWG